jgi:hypothetical protein
VFALIANRGRETFTFGEGNNSCVEAHSVSLSFVVNNDISVRMGVLNQYSVHSLMWLRSNTLSSSLGDDRRASCQQFGREPMLRLRLLGPMFRKEIYLCCQDS